MFRSAAHRADREHNDRAWLAWHIAALTRTKKMPKLQKLQVRVRRKPQTGEQMLQIAKMLTVALGGTVVQRKKD